MMTEGIGLAWCMQRVYGITFPDQASMKDYQHRMEEAKKRDHRNIGTQQELFFFDRLSPGSCFFMPNGARIYNALVEVRCSSPTVPRQVGCHTFEAGGQLSGTPFSEASLFYWDASHEVDIQHSCPAAISMIGLSSVTCKTSHCILVNHCNRYCPSWRLSFL